MQKLAAVLFTILATHAIFAYNALAFEGRPVSDLRFEGRASFTQFRIASDGTDFLLLSSAYEFGHPQRVFTQKIVGGQPVGPQRQIAMGVPAELAWTGSHYLAAWRSEGSLWLASLSREGSLISTPARIPNPDAPQRPASFVVADLHGALAFARDANRITTHPLDLAGAPAGEPRTYDGPQASSVAVGPAAGGYAVVFTGFHGTWLMTFRADGSAITAGPVLLDGPYGPTSTDRVSNQAVVTTNGTETMVVFGTRQHAVDADLRSAVVGADGTVKSVKVIDSIDLTSRVHGEILPAGLTWDGAQYVAALTINGPHLNGVHVDAALARIASDGGRIGERMPIAAGAGTQWAADLGWNGRELLVPVYDSTGYPEYNSFCVAVDPVTWTPRVPSRIGRTLSTQDKLTIETTASGYLAAWFEQSDNVHTIRVSRLDPAGNYLDGEGIVLATTQAPARYVERMIAIDTSGPRWFVVWSDRYRLWGSFLSHRGLPEGRPFLVAEGNETAVRWNGSNHVVLHSFGSSMYSTTVSPTGAKSKPRTIAEYEDVSSLVSIQYRNPSLVKLGDRLLAVFLKERGECAPIQPVCGVAVEAVLGLFLDTPDAVPFPILTAPIVWQNVAVAGGPTHALLTWKGPQGIRGAFLSAAAPEQGSTAFTIRGDAAIEPAVAFDGHEFLVTSWSDSTLTTVRITTSGAIHDWNSMSIDFTESGRRPVIAASATQRALTGFIGQLAAYDNVARGVVLFPGENRGRSAPPPAPEITCATRIEDGLVRVQWAPVTNVLGVAIELQLPDGHFRTIGVAPAGATTATVPLPGLNGSVVRIRAWNGYGLSAPSGIAPSLPAPAADVHAMPTACAGTPVEVTAALTGTPPFVVHWSDGVMQTVSDGFTATRLMTLDRDTRIAVHSVTDASCEAGTSNGGVDIQVTEAPLLTQQSRTVRVPRNQAATLSVVTATHGTRFAWYEGVRGDTAHPVGRNNATFTTPPATRTVQYWVRLTTSCGTIDSETMTVSIDIRRRAARK